jgi:hypothetical protein
LGSFSSSYQWPSFSLPLTLVGLMVNAAFGIAWVDSLAALLAVPLLIKETQSA